MTHRCPSASRKIPRASCLEVFVGAVLLATGCGSTGGGGKPSGTTTPVHVGAADSGPPASTGDAAPPAQVCNGPGYSSSSEATIAFSHLSATVVDTTGAPVPSVTAQTCGVNLCLNGTTNANGFVDFDQAAMLDQPAFKYGDARGYARFAYPLRDPPIKVDLGSQITVAFDAPSAGVPLDAGTDATSNGVTLSLAANMNPVAPDPFDFDTTDLQHFRAAVVPPEHTPAAVDPSLGLEIVVALTPEGTELCPAAKMRVANTPGWPKNSKVEFYLHGVDVAEEWAPYGGWAKISDGTVTPDGTRVETDASGGIPSLSVVGIRLVKD